MPPMSTSHYLTVAGQWWKLTPEAFKCLPSPLPYYKVFTGLQKWTVEELTYDAEVGWGHGCANA